MGLKKSGLKKENSRPQDPGLFGVIDEVTPTILGKKTTKDLQIPLNHHARKLEQAPRLKAEHYKAKAIIFIREMSMR
ncbi:MAG: hypothetical protein OEX09_04720 [Candidatus Bathyarchaeota archaeon]|nr:hypothetical protein [Candidatus Bathyarchaeota archaeon]